MNIQFENRYYSDKLMISEYVHKILCKRIYLMGAVFAPIALIHDWNNADQAGLYSSLQFSEYVYLSLCSRF